MDLTHLPRSGKLRIYATADYVTPESAEFGTAEHQGYVESLDADHRSIYASRNDVEPLAEYVIAEDQVGRFIIDEDTWEQGGNWRHAQEQVLQDIRDLIESLGGHDSDNGSTIYAHRTRDDVDGYGGWMTYAIHAHVKHYGAGRGWVEDDIDILTGLTEEVTA